MSFSGILPSFELCLDTGRASPRQQLAASDAQQQFTSGPLTEPGQPSLSGCYLMASGEKWFNDLLYSSNCFLFVATRYPRQSAIQRYTPKYLYVICKCCHSSLSIICNVKKVSAHPGLVLVLPHRCLTANWVLKESCNSLSENNIIQACFMEYLRYET